MDQFISQCLNLGGCVDSSASAVEIVKRQENPFVLDIGRPLVPSEELASYPPNNSHLIGEFLPKFDKDRTEIAFDVIKPITLCLSQDVRSKLASCWSFGFLPPSHPWEPSNVKIDKEYLITDSKGCLQLLEQEDPKSCRMAITVLVVKLSETLNDFPSALYDLRITIEELKDYLKSVKHIVFSINEDVSCCFTLNDARGKLDEIRQSVDNSNAIFEIIYDLHTCWSDYSRPTARQLFAFYFKRRVKPASDTYLAKFVIPLNSDHNRKLFDEEASKLLSTKIMWVRCVKSPND